MTLLRSGVSFFNANRTAVIAAAGVLAVVAAALAGWDFYASRQNRRAAEEYATAVNLYHDGKYKEALDALKRLETYKTSIYSRLGLLYTANTETALQDPAKAAAALRRLIANQPSEPIVRQTAFLSLGYAQEQAGQFGEAVSSFTEAEKMGGPLKGEASLGKARCSALAGDLKEALASYRAYVRDNPSADRINVVALRIQELEAKIGESAASAK